MNISEAIESGKRYNRAIRQSHWEKDVYLYDNDEGNLFLNSPTKPEIHGKKYEPHISCLGLETEWVLSHDAPWSGPAGVITRERAEEMIKQAFDKCTDEEMELRSDKLYDLLIDLIMTLGNSTIAFTESAEESASKDWNQK